MFIRIHQAPKILSRRKKNPKGIPSISPALTRSGYAGLVSQNDFNSKGVASLFSGQTIQPIQG
jgi:hypothetical protein